MSEDRVARPLSEPLTPSGEGREFGEAMDVVISTPVEVTPVIDSADPTPKTEDFDA